MQQNSLDKSKKAKKITNHRSPNILYSLTTHNDEVLMSKFYHDETPIFINYDNYPKKSKLFEESIRLQIAEEYDADLKEFHYVKLEKE